STASSASSICCRRAERDGGHSGLCRRLGRELPELHRDLSNPMTDVTIYGPAMSTYVRTVRLACAEKGVAHAMEEVEFGSDAHRKLHPFGKVPIMRHGDFVLYESEAICRYVDRAFPGPPLQPTDAKALARMDQWLSAIRDYVYPVMIEDLVWERLVVPMEGGQPNE